MISNPVISLVSSTAYAAPAVVPVAGEAIYALLVALGLIVGNEAGEYIWKGNGDPYVDSIFESQVSGITSGVPISDKMIEDVQNKVLPKDAYTTDGSNFYVAGKPITATDIYLQAASLADTSYAMPTNVTGVLPSDTGVFELSTGGYRARCVFDFEAGTDEYYIPYFVSDTNSYIVPCAINILSNPDGKKGTAFCYNFNTGEGTTYTNTVYGKYIFYKATIPKNGDNSGTNYTMSTTTNDNPQYTSYTVGQWKDVTSFFRVSGTGDYDVTKVKATCLLRTIGRPTPGIIGDKEKLTDAVVKAEPPTDDDDDPNTPPVPNPPTKWELWKSLEDLILFLDSGDPNNGGTDYGQYVNNNYNYVQVDVNLPDSQNVNISGSLDIDKKGDINVTVHEDVSLPDAGNGEGFYNPDAADVVGAIGKDNPVTNMLAGLFSAIDPTLLAVFSTGVSLMIVLGLWKMIRG